jgi:AraC-like DNA-binding protein
MLAARVAWTFHHVRAPGNSLKAVALRLGYADTVKLSRHVRWMTGMTLSQLRRTATADQVLELLRARILRAEEPSSVS